MYTVEFLEQKSLYELKAIARDRGITPSGDKRFRQVFIEALIDVKPVAESIEHSPGVTFSARFLDRYSPPQANIHFRSDADGQLSLLDFEIEDCNEPPDPDDFVSMSAFWTAYQAWESSSDEGEYCEFSFMFVEATPVLTGNIFPLVEATPVAIEATEDTNRCPCGAMPAAQCDGTTATHIYSDRIVFTPCYRNLDGACRELVFCSNRVRDRSPPGGDAIP